MPEMLEIVPNARWKALREVSGDKKGIGGKTQGSATFEPRYFASREGVSQYSFKHSFTSKPTVNMVRSGLTLSNGA